VPPACARRAPAAKNNRQISGRTKKVLWLLILIVFSW
jgi:hypothetical protein